MSLLAAITESAAQWPTWDQWRRVIGLADHNTRVVIFGTCLLGAAAGLIGSFTLLRRRALMGDALSHATLPGICIAFLLVTAAGGDGKTLSWLLAGATISGMIGVGSILAIRNLTRLKEDAALGIVLSVFFGVGVALLGVIQQMKTGHAAGLEAFIYGKTASMTTDDAGLIAIAAAVSLVVSGLLSKELKLLCFDEAFAGSRGYSVVLLDGVLMGLVVIVAIVGLQAVGLILVIALLVIPAASARFWTDRMWPMALIATLLGGMCGMVGAGGSAVFSRLPSGALIVLVCAAFFFLSLVFGVKRGLVARTVRRVRLKRSVDRQHLLRAIYEIAEASGDASGNERFGSPVATTAAPFDRLLGRRSWSSWRLRRAIARAERAMLVSEARDGVRLTANGVCEAQRLTRQHRLWELYLITHADVATTLVDREADAIEHVLEPSVIAELESLLRRQAIDVPDNPHAESGQALSGGQHAGE